MKKNTTPKRQSPKRAVTPQEPITIGMDLGDKKSRYCMLDSTGEILLEDSVGTNQTAMREKFQGMRGCRVAIEVGTHSPWVSRLMSRLGLEVIVANARQVKLISASSRKNDRLDARLLARLARADRELLRPIRHRSEEAQMDLLQIRLREGLVEARTKLINTARGLVKALGERLPKCDADSLGKERLEGLPASLREAVEPLMGAD
jgi:transposase